MTVRTHVGHGGSLNLGDGPTERKIEGILHAIAFGGVTLLGMQEGSDRVKLLERLVELLTHPIRVARRLAEKRRERREIRGRLAVMGWRVFIPRVPGGAAVPIAYDRKVWQVLRARTIVAVGRAWVGAVGAGPTYAKPKCVAVLVVRHRATGVVVEHGNTHMLPSVLRNDLPPKEEEARRRHYKQHAERLALFVRRARERGHGVLVTLDANAERTAGIVDPLRDAGLVGWTAHSTHDSGRGIDHVLTARGTDLVGAPARVIFLRGFDHRLVVRPLYVKAALHAGRRVAA
jgi:hypothetical protein